MGFEPGHEAERRGVEDFFGRVENGPAGLALGGQPGIGKTTLWAYAVDSAEKAGWTVLSARAGRMESSLTYSVLADLLRAVPDDVLGRLPRVQQLALDRVLLRGDDGPPTDERVTAAAFLSVLEQLSGGSPVLIAIDDIQWLDAASRTVVGYAAARLRGPIGMVITSGSIRPHASSWASWLALPSGGSFARITMRPLTLGAVQRVVAQHVGCTLSRPAIARIHQLSEGNPLFALELARSLQADDADRLLHLPAALDDLLQRHVEVAHPSGASVLLALACLTETTPIQLALATDIVVEELAELLDDAESRDIVTMEGNRVRFAHPLLAHAVYSAARAPQRRAMHRRLAAIVDHPERRARHLALGSIGADAETLQALDEAATLAAGRGAPSAAAELFDMAIRLGGDDPVRRLRAAEQHFRSGAFEDAEKHLAELIDGSPPSPVRTTALMLRGAVHGYRDGTVAMPSLIAAVEESEHPWMRVQATLLLALVHGVSGDLVTCVDFARRAVMDAELTGDPAIRSQAMTLLVHTRTIHGDGIDTEMLDTALELEDITINAPATLSARNVAAVLHAWAGDLERARTEMATVSRRCRSVGNEVDVVWAAQFSTMVELWLGNPDAAEQISAEALEDADLIGGRMSHVTAMTCAAAIAAFRGRDIEAERWARSAVDGARDSGWSFMKIAPLVRAFEARRDAFVQLIRKPGGQVNAALVEASIAATEPLLDLLDAHLARQPFMAGGQLTMADIPIACEIHRWRGTPVPHTARAHLDRWYQHVLALPASRGVLDIALS